MMASSITKTLYHALSHTPPTIRLFTLLSSPSAESPLQGHLTTVPLDSPPRYEALSYAWGAPSGSEDYPISIDGHVVLATPNLDAALRSLRLHGDARVLWIDALCINQQSTAERSHQVSLMQAIYSKCTRDLLWLGPKPYSGVGYKPPDEEALGNGLRLMKLIADKDITTVDTMERNWIIRKRKVDKWGYFWYIDEHEEKRKKREARERGEHVEEEEEEPIVLPTEMVPSNKRFLSSEEQSALELTMSWPDVWGRLWVMQELSLAPKIQLVAGRHTLDWDVISGFLGDTPYADAFHGTFSHGSVYRMVGEIFRKVQTIDHQRRMVNEIRQTKAESSLLDVLARFRASQASDPRDKIYGLLGLANDSLKQSIQPNYSKEPAQVYAEVTATIIEQSGNLDIVCQSPWRSSQVVSQTRSSNSPDAFEGLPSWAADFRVDGQVHLFAQRSIFNAGRETFQVPCRTLDNTVLVTRGVQIGRVGPILQADYDDRDRRAGQTPLEPRWQRRDHLHLEWLLLCLGREVLEEPRAYITGESAFSAFWRTLVIDCEAYPMKRLTADQISDGDSPLRELWSNALKLQERGKDEQGEKKHDRVGPFPQKDSVGTMWSELNDAWTFSLTDNGLYLMITPPTVEGDIIACLDGGKVPVVLRPIEHSGDGERYRVVAVAYVHGFMDTEATESKELIEKLGLKEQEFWLV